MVKLQLAVLALLCSSAALRPAARRPQLRMQYVPDGMTAAQYNALRKKEKADAQRKDFGRGGARGFESRSMNSFVAALEKGQAKHLMPVNPAEVRAGKIALKDVPYMQRGGAWDNKDLTGRKGWQKTGFGMTAFNDGKAKKLQENKWDAVYNKQKPSNSLLGFGNGLDWTGKGATGDSVAGRAKKNGISNDQQMWRDAGALTPEQIRRQRGGQPKLKFGQQANGAAAPPKKKLFGLF